MADTRMMAVVLAHWATDRWWRRHGRRVPVAERDVLLLVEPKGQQTLVAACDAEARRLGVRPGMPLAQARPVLPRDRLRVEPMDAPGQDRDLQRLGVWAQRFTPRVAVAGSDTLWLDVTGTDRLWGPAEGLVDRVEAALRRQRLTARAAVAPSFAAACALARFGRGTRVVADPGDLRDALSPLPVAALRLEPRVIQKLGDLGIQRVGQLLALPRRDLPSRFGRGLLLRVDQALGDAWEPMEPLAPPRPLVFEQRFEGPTEQRDAVTEAARQLVGVACEPLRRRGLGALRLVVSLVHPEGPDTVIELRLSQPHRDPGHLWRLLAPKLELEPQPTRRSSRRSALDHLVEAVVLSLPETGPLGDVQAQAFTGPTGSAPDRERALHEMLDTALNRLGPQRVRAARPVAHHLPERAWREEPVHTVPTSPPVADPHEPMVSLAERPLQLAARPEPIEVEHGEPPRGIGDLRAFHWQGQRLTITTARGPERLTAPWWEQPPPEGDDVDLTRQPGLIRDYVQAIDTAGRWHWLFRDPLTGRWFRHGGW